MGEDTSLPDETQIGRVALRVGDLDRQVAFYDDVVGLATMERNGDMARLGVDGTELLRLEERSDLPPRGSDETGLFHTAFLFPDRAALGDALQRVEERWQLTGASDHLVSEALYLDDPEGNGVELYHDRPKSAWTIADDGRIGIDTLPLDLGPIRDAAGGGDAAPAGTAVGHVHLEVSDIEAARQFYVGDLGFDRKAAYGGAAIFLAAGEYHHHVGANTWNGRTAPGTGRGLDWFEVVVPDEEALAEARDRLEAAGHESGGDGFVIEDPDGITIRIRTAD